MSDRLSLAAEPPQTPSVGYVVKRFPRLSETFILNELRMLRWQGTPVEVFSLMPPEAQQQETLLADLDVPVHYLPDREAVGALPVTERHFGRDRERQHNLRRSLRKAPSLGQPPFPGKRFSQCATLQAQAAVLASLAAARGMDHLHAHFASDAATVAMLASRLSDIPFSMTAHAKDIYHTYSDAARDQAFLARKLREAAFTVTVSNYNRDHLRRLGGPGAKVYRLYNGVDLERLECHHEPREPGLVVAVGRLVEKKGFADLVAACGRLQRRGGDFRCVIIGEGPERAALEEQIRRHGLEECVSLVGSLPQEEVFRWLRRAALFALPCIVSRSGDRDGLPTVILECMALGTPVIATRVAGVPEMIDHGSSGWLVEPQSPTQLAETLQEVLEASPERRREVARQARRKAEKQFDLRQNVSMLRSLFESVHEAEPPRMREAG